MRSKVDVTTITSSFLIIGTFCHSYSMTSSHWKILSAWSKAGIGTNVVLELLPLSAVGPGRKKMKSLPRIAFDMGATPCFDDAIPAKYVFLSHGHIDHVGAVFSHARAHSVSCGGEAPTYFVPADLVPHLEQCREAMISLDASQMHNSNGGRKESLIQVNFISVKPGDEFILKGIHSGSKTSFFMRAFQVDHCGHPALGYVIGSRTTSGLKEEYQSLDNATLRELAMSGVVLQSDPIEKIEVAYTGDTCANGLKLDQMRPLSGDASEKSVLYKQQLFQAEVILCELTYLDSSEEEEGRRRAAERGHLHICELERLFMSNESNDDTRFDGPVESVSTCVLDRQTKHIVFYHLSGRCGPATRALDMIADGIPRQLHRRCQVAVSSLLTSDEKHSLGRLIQPNGCVSLMAYLAWRGRPK
ncbi:hypothetical protein HJC23_011924 [Cyclotella cryptica]|uniref:Metallo-beta-lactamase domain-containing protein n=1 Tax=Cyclotella cryptica TaxID=29204 RepID=A0ABD3NLJ4_9STRA